MSTSTRIAGARASGVLRGGATRRDTDRLCAVRLSLPPPRPRHHYRNAAGVGRARRKRAAGGTEWEERHTRMGTKPERAFVIYSSGERDLTSGRL